MWIRDLGLVLMILVLGACSSVPAPDPQTQEPEVLIDPLEPATALVPFGSEDAFNAYVAAWRERGDVWEWERDKRYEEALAVLEAGGPVDCYGLRYEHEDCADWRDRIVVTGSMLSDSITNNQVGNVDEGGIVKRIGNRVIVMRDGRLFVLNIGEEGEDPVLEARIDLYSDPGEGTWFDEILVSGNRIVVTGYSYQYDAASYSILEMSETGEVSPVDRFFLSSNDYFDGSSYATRMIENTLVFEMPVWIEDLADDFVEFPQFFRIDEQGRRVASDQGPIVDRADVFRPLIDEGFPSLQVLVRCDLDELVALGTERGCQSVAFVANGLGSLYVGPEQAYFWSWGYRHPTSLPEQCQTSTFRDAGPAPVFRVDLDAMELSVAPGYGVPQRPFWMAERQGGITSVVQHYDDDCVSADRDAEYWELRNSLVHLTANQFSQTYNPADASILRHFPIYGSAMATRVKYVGDYVLVAGATPYYAAFDTEHPSSGVSVIRLDGSEPDQIVPVSHDIGRVEGLGENFGLVIGTRGTREAPEMVYSAIVLGRVPYIADQLSIPHRMPVEGRTHAINMTRAVEDEVEGFVVGLASRRLDEDVEARRYRHHGSGVNFISLVEGDDPRLVLLGNGDPEVSEPDESYSCGRFCTDWYGVTRAFFLNDRVFALTNVELIEVELHGAFEGELEVLNRTRLDLPVSPAH